MNTYVKGNMQKTHKKKQKRQLLSLFCLRSYRRYTRVTTPSFYKVRGRLRANISWLEKRRFLIVKRGFLVVKRRFLMWKTRFSDWKTRFYYLYLRVSHVLDAGKQ